MVGAGATVALIGVVNIASGELSYLAEPLDGAEVNLLPKFHEEMKVILLGTGVRNISFFPASFQERKCLHNSKKDLTRTGESL